MGAEQREFFINLIYQMKEFSEQELFDRLSTEKIVINNFLRFKEHLLSLQEIGALRYNGITYKVVPAEERLSYRRYFLRAGF